MLTDKITITELIPQRHPMIMIDELIEATEDLAVSTFKIGNGNIFVSNDLFTEPGLVENIAQTAAAHAGYLYRQQNVPVPVGFIAAIKDLKVYDLPVIHSSVKTTVTITNKVFEVTIIRGTVEQEGRTLCSCEMKIFTRSA